MFVLAFLVASGPTCHDNGEGFNDREWRLLTALSPVPPAPSDASNVYADVPAAARLGRRFFFDPAFSGLSRQMDSLRQPTMLARAPAGQPIRISCATCHDANRGGIDTTSSPNNVSVGAGVTDVNAQGTLNAAQHQRLFWNGRVDSLWGLNLIVAESETTLNGNRLQTAHVIADRYGPDFEATFPGLVIPDWRMHVAALPAQGRPGRVAGCQAGDPAEPDADAYDCLDPSARALADDLLVAWAKAIAAYVRQLVSRDSAFDRFVAEGPASAHISGPAKRGARLFVGKAGCIDCHNGPLLSDGKLHNIGVPQEGPSVPTLAACAAGSPCDCAAGRNCLPWGAYNGQTWRRETGARWLAFIAAHRDDLPVANRGDDVPPDDELKGAWRTPSLRDVALTAPYMHNGFYRSLEEVLWHYNSGGRGGSSAAVGMTSVKIKPLGLTDEEINDLIAFLATLTGAPLPSELIKP